MKRTVLPALAGILLFLAFAPACASACRLR
jgi:hypothetical protein